MRREYEQTSSPLPSGYRAVRWITSPLCNAYFKVAWNMKSLSVIKRPGYTADVRVTEANRQEAYNVASLFVYSSSGYTNFGVTLAQSPNHRLTICYSPTSGSGNYEVDNGEEWQTVGFYTDSDRKITILKADGSIVNTGQTHRARYDYADQYIGVFRGWIGNPSGWGTSVFTSNLSMGRLTLLDGETVLYDFYPCVRTSDNTAGMYDLANDVFYSSESSTQFIAEGE